MRDFLKYCRLRLPSVPMECILGYIIIKLIKLGGVPDLLDLLNFVKLLALGELLYYALRKVLKSDEVEQCNKE